MADANEATKIQLELGNANDESHSSGLIEITTYIREDQAFALEILGNAEMQRPNKDLDKASLIQEALDLLIEKHLVVVDLRKNQIAKNSG